jgi:hypothetical protein
MAHLKFNVASNPRRSNAAGSRPPAAKKGHHMAKAAPRKKKAANGGMRKKASRNPAMFKKKRRHNPSGLVATIGSPKDLVTGGVAGLVAAIATRQLPQMILTTANSGWEGYAANAVTALAATWAAGTFMGPAAGRGALIGGMVILLDRILSEQVSPISSYLSLSGVGDAAAYSKLGTIRAGYYSHPNLQNPDGSMYVPDPVTEAAMQAVAARYPQLAAPMAQAASGGGRVGAVNPSSLRRHTANGMLMSSRFQGRFNQ